MLTDDKTREEVRDEARLAAGAAKLAAKDALSLAKRGARDLIFALAGEVAVPTAPVSDPVIATGDQMSAALDRILTWAQGLDDMAIPRTVSFAMREGQTAMEDWTEVRKTR